MFSGTKGRPIEASRSSGPEIAAQFLRSRARQIIGSAGQEAADGVGMSPFCRAFLEALTPVAGGPTFVHTQRLYSFITLKMENARVGRDWQVPVLTCPNSEPGSFVFFLPTK